MKILYALLQLYHLLSCAAICLELYIVYAFLQLCTLFTSYKQDTNKFVSIYMLSCQ